MTDLQPVNLSKRLLLISLVMLLVTGMLVWQGCASRTTRRIAFDLQSGDAHLKKQAGIAYLRNQTSFGDPGLNTIFEQTLLSNLHEEGPTLLIKKAGDNNFPDEIIDPPLMADGRIDNLALARAGREIGLNAVIVCTLYDVHQDQASTGMLWFKDSRSFIFVQLLVEVFDTLTAAKILDESYIREIELDKDRAEMVRNDLTLTTSAIIQAMNKLIPDISEDIIDVVLTKPWRGFIRATSGSKVFISSGRRVGVGKGAIFEVNKGGRVLQGADGQRFFLPSEPYAKIQVTTVFPEWSETVIIEGDAINKDSYLRPVKK